MPRFALSNVNKLYRRLLQWLLMIHSKKERAKVRRFIYKKATPKQSCPVLITISIVVFVCEKKRGSTNKLRTIWRLLL